MDELFDSKQLLTQEGADLLNGLRELVQQTSITSVQGGLTLSKSGSGTALALPKSPVLYGELSGSTSPYGMTEKRLNSSGTWVSGARSCSACAYALNSEASLSGKRAKLRPSGLPNKWLFDYVVDPALYCGCSVGAIPDSILVKFGIDHAYATYYTSCYNTNYRDPFPYGVTVTFQTITDPGFSTYIGGQATVIAAGNALWLSDLIGIYKYGIYLRPNTVFTGPDFCYYMFFRYIPGDSSSGTIMFEWALPYGLNTCSPFQGVFGGDLEQYGICGGGGGSQEITGTMDPVVGMLSTMSSSTCDYDYPYTIKNRKANIHKELVVARYKEDVSWLKDSPIPVTLYDRCPGPQDYDFNNDDNVIIRYLENVGGREAAVYLNHIVDNWDSLADITCFVQGSPHNATVEEFFGRRLIDYQDTTSLSCRYDDLGTVPPWITEQDLILPDIGGFEIRLGHTAPDNNRPGWNGACQLDREVMWNAIFDCPMPADWFFGYAAQWSVPRNRIKDRGINFYRRLLALNLQTASVDASMTPDHLKPYSAWSFEMVASKVWACAEKYPAKLPPSFKKSVSKGCGPCHGRQD